MDYGLCYFPTDYGMDPTAVARAAEYRGFESLFFTEHTHIPASRRTPYPGGGDLPRMYVHTHDVFVALTAAAAATTTIKLGTGVCLLVERDPILTAKEVASLDVLSGGRLLFGVGSGWNREEMENHGTDPRVRVALLGERVKAMQEIWTRDEAEFHGRYVDFDGVWSWPKPVQRPHPPVMVGGMGPTVEERILEYGDAWIAQRVDLDNVDEFGARVAAPQRRAEQAGRGRVPVTLFGASTRPETLSAYAEAGIDRCLFLLPDGETEQLTGTMDQLAEQVRS